MTSGRAVGVAPRGRCAERRGTVACPAFTVEWSGMPGELLGCSRLSGGDAAGLPQALMWSSHVFVPHVLWLRRALACPSWVLDPSISVKPGQFSKRGRTGQKKISMNARSQQDCKAKQSKAGCSCCWLTQMCRPTSGLDRLLGTATVPWPQPAAGRMLCRSSAVYQPCM